MTVRYLFRLTQEECRHALERARLIHVLGMAPEPEGVGTGHPEAYAARTGELRMWAEREQGWHGPWA